MKQEDKIVEEMPVKEPERRKCKECGEEKELCRENFSGKGKDNFGNARFKTVCKKCIEFQEQEYIKNIDNCPPKKCNECKIEKQLNCFNLIVRKNKIQSNDVCYDCINKKDRIKRNKGIETPPNHLSFQKADGLIYKICNICNVEKNTDYFYKMSKKRKGWRPTCIDCMKKEWKIPWEKLTQKKYKPELKNNILVKICKICLNEKELNDINWYFRKDHNGYISTCRDCVQKINSEHFQNNKSEYAYELKILRNTDPIVGLRHSISCTVRGYLKAVGFPKRGDSISKYLSFTSLELQTHVENLFSHPDNLTPDGKIWMNWKNRGKYNPKIWDDNDPSTWAWQLDHIIPHSDLPYISMEDENFKICWSLENLRPLAAKQNLLDGVNRVRHKNKSHRREKKNAV